MNLPSELFPGGWHVFAALLSVLLLWRQGWRAPWHWLHKGGNIHVWLGAAVLLTLLWSLRAGVLPGLNLHLLGAMAATLAFGPGLAMLVLALALTGITLNGALDWAAWPINFLLMAAVPVLFADAIRRLVERRLPHHFFIYIFVVAFFGAGLTAMLQGVVASGALVLAGAYPLDFLLSEYLPYFLLLGFSEAWLSGAAITLLVVYRPESVATFDDREYLSKK